MILSRYIAGFFVRYLLLTLGLIAMIVFLIDTIELLRRASNVADATIFHVLILATLHLPLLIETVLPFTVVMGGVFAFLRLNGSLTLAISRASGYSIWQILLPVVVVSGGLGFIMSAGFSVITANAMTLYQNLETEFLGVSQSTNSAINLTESLQSGGRYVIISNGSQLEAQRLLGVTVLRFDAQDRLINRIDGASMTLANGNWLVSNGQKTQANGRIEAFENIKIPTSFEEEELRTRLIQPFLLSIWQLPENLQKAKKLGIDHSPYEMRLFGYLVLPALLAALACMSSLFSLQLSRGSNIARILILATATAFVAFISIDLIYDLGAAGWIPAWLAACLPVISITGICVTRLLYTEDG